MLVYVCETVLAQRRSGILRISVLIFVDLNFRFPLPTVSARNIQMSRVCDTNTRQVL